MAPLTKDERLQASEPQGQIWRVVANAKFELVLALLLLLTAAAVIWQDRILERTIAFTPASTASSTRIPLSDVNDHGHSVIRETAPLSWTCDLRPGYAYPYCAYELFFDGKKGTHGLNLTNMRSLAVTMMYRGASSSFRIHLKNFDPRYSRNTSDDTPKFLRVEANTTPGRLQQIEFTPADFGVADWWLRKFKLAPQYGHPQFDNITSMNFETGSEATFGPHSFEVRSIVIRTAILSQSEWYSLLLGIWIVMTVAYLGYRLTNLRRATLERQALAALALREAQEAARLDPLTGILNRRGLTERFTEALQKRKSPAAVTTILIDVDHFKALNDTYGHERGDRVLAEIATIISSNVRAVDIVARWGGEEFIVICSGIDRKGAQYIAEKIRGRIEQASFDDCGQVTASLGVHWSDAPDPDLSQLVALADIALYAAKAGGRNCCKLYRAATSKAA